MPRVKQVDDVAILEWGAGDPPTLVGELRTLVEGGSARRVLLDLNGFDGLRADGLESLTEALTVCADRGCAIGLFGGTDAYERIVELMDLAEDVPPHLGRGEAEAISQLKARGLPPQNGRGAPAARPAATTRPSAAPAPRTIELEIDLSAAATAPTTKFDRGEVVSVTFGAKAPAAASAGGAQPDEDLLGIDWAPLLASGYQLGGPDAAGLVARVGPVSAAAATPPAPAPTAPRARPAEDDGVIDLGEVTPARVPARGGGLRKTEVLPAFSGVVEEGAAASVLDPRDGGDFSPLDAGPTGPPAGVLARGGVTSPPGGPPPAQRPSAERKSERFAPPPRRPTPAPVPSAAPTRPPVPAAAAFAAPPAPTPAPASNPYAGGAGAMYESDDQTVMFTPGALDAAMLAAAAGTPEAPPAADPPAAAEPVAAASAAAAGVGEGEEETVMFQLGALDAELLAQVAAAAGPEAGVAPPRVEEPPPPAQPALDAPDGRDLELRLFMHDHALATPLHLQVLDRLSKVTDAALGRSELQLATGAALGTVSGVVDQLVAARLLRRTRAPRVRGGVGFVLAMSPAGRNTLARLLKTWQAPATRAKVAGWFDGGA